MKLVDSIPAPDHVDVKVLGVATAELYTVPTGAKYVVFSTLKQITGVGNDFYINKNVTATVPAADVADGSGSFINPGMLNVVGVPSISLISPAALVVTIAAYGGAEDDFKL